MFKHMERKQVYHLIESLNIGNNISCLNDENRQKNLYRFGAESVEYSPPDNES